MTAPYVEATAPPRCCCGHTIGGHLDTTGVVSRCHLMCCGCLTYRPILRAEVDDLDALTHVDPGPYLEADAP